ncbi:MAG TPA: hypothetical protein VMX94_04510 [Armatimonadota bacterium]|nr:hypothetical protein [Armatimonadota bacterium]
MAFAVQPAREARSSAVTVQDFMSNRLNDILDALPEALEDSKAVYLARL